MEFQILSKNIEFEILFLEMLTLTHVLARDFFAQHSQLWVTKVFTADIDINCFSTDVGRDFFGQNFFVLYQPKLFFSDID